MAPGAPHFRPVVSAGHMQGSLLGCLQPALKPCSLFLVPFPNPTTTLAPTL